VTHWSWFTNLDAERELERPTAYQVSKAVSRIVSGQRETLHWLTLGDVSFAWDDLRAAHAPDAVVLCWCPTPAAIAALRRRRFEVVAGPGLDVLQRVNHRRFQLQFDGPLPRAFVQGEAATVDLRWLEGSSGRRWRLKRPYGFAGRGQRVLREALSDDDRRWVIDSLRGGFVREPDVDVLEEWSMHGVVLGERVLVGEPCRQWCDAFGSVVRLERCAPDLETGDALHRAVREVAGALARSGYFGPFGIDGFVYREGSDRVINPISDVNARFTLGWSIGMGDRRDEALRLYADGR